MPSTPRLEVDREDSCTHIDICFANSSTLPPKIHRQRVPASLPVPQSRPPVLPVKPQKVLQQLSLSTLFSLSLTFAAETVTEVCQIKRCLNVCVLLQFNQLRLTPVRQTRKTHMINELESFGPNSMHSQANVRVDCLPGPGQYHIDSSRQLKKQDFRRPHNPVSCFPVFF